MKDLRLWSLLIAPSLCLLACGSDDDEEKKPVCDVNAQVGCNDGQVCEQVTDGTAGCFAPLSISGKVVRSADGVTGIQGARVVARDVNGALVSRSVAISGVDGGYSLAVPATRNPDGSPAKLPEVLLRADAAGYATFPSGLRIALPIDTSTPVALDKGYLIQNAGTVIGLDALPDASTFGSISGVIKAVGSAGALVVVGPASGIADAEGKFEVFNVPAGSQEVRGYLTGLQLTSATAEVQAGKTTGGVELLASNDPLGAVSGDLEFVNAGTQTTSVVLVVESTFNDKLARGEVPRGLRQYPVTGKYRFDGVPAGNYVVLAAFENDELVRDPDTAIGGTAIQKITVGSGEVIVEGFKITGALDVVWPGAEKPDGVTGAPTFQWTDDSSEDGFELFVYDTFGNEIWKDIGVPRVTGAPTVSATYAGPALSAGYYQFKAVSWRSSTRDGGRTYISSTEDLKGVFIVP